MWGPGDVGPTSAAQLALDVVRGKLPGLVPGSFSVVDARDVALAQISAAEKGRRGKRYLAAGRHMTMRGLRDRTLRQLCGLLLGFDNDEWLPIVHAIVGPMPIESRSIIPIDLTLAVRSQLAIRFTKAGEALHLRISCRLLPT